MQIIRHFRQGPATFPEFFQCEIEEARIIGLEVYFAVLAEEPCVAVEETAIRQAPLGMALLGPGVAEIDEEAVYFAGRKISSSRATSKRRSWTLSTSAAAHFLPA